MARWKSLGRGSSIVVGILLMAQPSYAQREAPARPYRALFGGDQSNQRSRHQLDLTISVSAGRDDGLIAPAAGPTDSSSAEPRRESAEMYSGAAQLGYVFHGGRTEAGVSAATSLPYYSTLPDVRELAYSSRGNLNVVSGRSTMSATGAWSHSPFYSPAFEPGSMTLGADYGFALSPNDMVSAGASLGRTLSRSTSVSLGYSVSGTLFKDDDRSSVSQSIRLGADRRLSRSVTMNGGYGYAVGNYATAGVSSASASHDVSLGIGYTPRLPRGGSLTMSATIGASVVDYAQTRNEGWIGSVNLARSIGANWYSGAYYSRSLRLESALQQPVWADTAGVTVAGRFGRRVTFSLAASAVRGDRVGQRGQGYDIYLGTAQVQVALASFVAVTGGYGYSRYRFPAGYDLPAGVPHRWDRQRVQAGATFWLPLVRVGRAR